MRPITVNPFIKFMFLVVEIILIITTHNNLILYSIIIYSIIYLIINKTPSNQILNGLKFGMLLTIFMFIFSLIRYQEFTLAVYNAIDLFKMYLAMILVSICYKYHTTNKELAYVLSKVFSPLSIIGYNQNKLYTLFLVILNQIYNMRYSALRIHKYAKFKANDKLTIKQSINLIVPFINNNIKQNELLAIGLINNKYSGECKVVKPFFLRDYKFINHLVLIIIVLIQITLI